MQMNAYEVRTKILKMAKEQVNEEYYQRKDKWENSVKKDLYGKPVSMLEYPEPPTIQDIMTVADAMNKFVKTQV